MRQRSPAGELRMRFLVGSLAFSLTLGLEACDGCGRTRLSAAGADSAAGTLDSAVPEGGPWAGAGGGAGTKPDGAVTDAGGTGGRATGGAGPGGAAGGALAGGGGVLGGGGGGTAGMSGRGGSSPGGAPSGGALIGGKGGGASSGGTGSGGSATGGAGQGGGGTGGAKGGTSGAGSGGFTAGDASDRPPDSARPDGAVPLWRDSYEAFSQGVRGTVPLVASLWSDHRGVFLLAYDDDSPPSLWSNLGQGWHTTYTWPQGTTITSGPGRAALKGFVDGALVPLGVWPCSIQIVDGQDAKCSAASRSIADVAIIRADLAYAVYSDRILRFDGAFWTQLGDPLPPPDVPLSYGPLQTYALWADASTMLIATHETGTEGFVYVVSAEGKPVQQTELPKVGFTSAWGFGGNDLWVGSADGGLYHYDGSGWTQKGSLAADGYGIMRIWGADGNLFMVTSTELGHWDGTRLKKLESLGSGLLYRDLWGNSTKEVFVTLINYEDSTNHVFQARWFDGSSVRPL